MNGKCKYNLKTLDTLNKLIFAKWNAINAVTHGPSITDAKRPKAVGDRTCTLGSHSEHNYMSAFLLCLLRVGRALRRADPPSK
jgi:hypothetical protein